MKGFPATVSMAVVLCATMILADARATETRRDGAPKSSTGQALLYVAGFGNNAVEIYDVSTAGAQKAGEITTGIDGPKNLSVDPNGNLYVANQNEAAIVVYRPGADSPARTLSAGLTEANAAVADASGNVYVANGYGDPAIVVYPPGGSVPSRTIKSSLFGRPYGEVLDTAGNLYIADWLNGVLMLPAGAQQPVSLGLEGGGQPAGIAYVAKSNELFVNYFYAGKRRYRTIVYAPGNPAPLRTLSGVVSANGMVAGKVDHATYVFVPNYFSNAVYVYRRVGRKPLTVFTTDAQNANGVAFKPSGVP
jgi:lactonase family protein with 7-bladed beta-propeller